MLRIWLSVLCLLSAATCVQAADWTEFRGPGGDGHSGASDLPVNWSPTEHVAWKQEVPGKGWSSPVVLGGRIYLTSAVPRPGASDLEQDLFALCLDAESGTILWKRLLFEQTADVAQRIHKKNSHASPTPVTDGKHLWVHFGRQGTACLTLDGEVVWSTRELAYTMQHGNGSSPVLVDDILFINCDGSDVQYVAALDKATGELRWKRERPDVPNPKKFSFASPAAIEVDGRTQIVSPAADVVVAYDPKDGRELWRVRYNGYSVIPKPVYAHGLVYVSTSYDRPTLYAIDPTGSGDVTETHVKWKHEKNVCHTPSLLVVGDELYCVSDRGVATCFDATSGEVHWQERLGGRNFSASPLYADGRIYFLSEDGVTTVIEPGTTYREVARNDLQEPTLASFGVIGDDLLIRTESKLYRIR